MSTSVPLIETPLRIVGAPPFKTERATLHGMFVRGDKNKLQAICDSMINNLSGGRLSYRVVTPYLMLAALYADRTYSLDALDRKRGAVREKDIGFWILLFGGKAGEWTTWRLAWLPVFLFVDSSSALASGREMFGFPKDLGRITRSGDLKSDPCVRIDVEHIAAFDPDAIAEWDRMIEVSRRSAPAAAIEDIAPEDLSSTLAIRIQEGPEFDEMALLQDGKRLVDFQQTFKPVRMGLPSLLLKQFPAANAPRQSIHCSIVLSDLKNDASRGTRFLPGEYAVLVTQSDSHPMRTLLGISSNNAAHWPFCTEMDFTVPFGTTLWSAP